MNESMQLVTTTCSYKVMNGDTGEYDHCPEPSISPTMPFCFRHVPVPSTKAQTRYDVAMPTKLKEDYIELLKDSKPLDLIPEIAHLRALINEHLHHISSTIPGDGTPTRTTPKDKVLLMELMGKLAKLAEVEAKINPRDFIPIEDVKIMLKGIVDIIAKTVPSADVEVRRRLLNNIKDFCNERLSSTAVKPHTRT